MLQHIFYIENTLLQVFFYIEFFSLPFDLKGSRPTLKSCFYLLEQTIFEYVRSLYLN